MRSGIIILGFLLLHLTNVSAQKTEIVLVGIVHQMPDSFSNNWSKAYQKLLQYKADAIAVEWLQPDDPLSHVKYFDANYRHRFDSVMLKWEGKLINPSDSIVRYTTLLQQKKEAFYRYKLWQYYYLNIDMGNAEYQLFQIMHGDQSWFSHFDSSSYPAKAFLRSLRRSATRLKNTEHHNLVFPLAKQLHINYLYPTDDNSTFSYQSDAYGRLSNALKGTEELKQFESFWQAYSQNEATLIRKGNVIERINQPSWIDSTDIGQARILYATHNTHARDYVNIWYFRNKNLARRIAEAATKSKAKKMIVVYGNIHVYPIKKYLEEMGYRVKLLGDL
jgi:hypothetical protein